MIENIRKRIEAGDYWLTTHAFERCVERSISPEEIKYVILTGEIIEDYPKDKYAPVVLSMERAEREKHCICSVRLTPYGLSRRMTQL